MILFPDTMTDSYLANSVPNKEHFQTYLASLLDALSGKELNFGQILSPIFRTFSVVVEYDFGVFHLRALLRKRNQLLHDFCSRFARLVSR